MSRSFILKGDICHSRDIKSPETVRGGYIVCADGVSRGVFPVLPERYAGMPLIDCGDNIIIPGLCDLHVHAPQYSFRALGMDLELLEWLETHAFPEEARYHDTGYAEKAYSLFVEELVRGPNTRACVFATVHAEATALLMAKLEASGLVTMAGKVNMDRSCPDGLREQSAAGSLAATRRWLDDTCGRFRNTYPILTPRFIPSCTDELMHGLGELQREYGLPVQSHLSENKSEIELVRRLCPDSRFYGDAYARFGLFGGEGAPTVMAHCVWSPPEEIELMRQNGVYIAHCPQSNANLASGVAPVRRFLDAGLNVGLGSDMAGGCHSSIFRAMSDAVQFSKLRWRLFEQSEAPLTIWEAFHLGTAGGGGFFGKVGCFDDGFELDAVVIDDSSLATTRELTIAERVERIIYLSDDRHIRAKYVRGKRLAL